MGFKDILFAATLASSQIASGSDAPGVHDAQHDIAQKAHGAVSHDGHHSSHLHVEADVGMAVNHILPQWTIIEGTLFSSGIHGEMKLNDTVSVAAGFHHLEPASHEQELQSEDVLTLSLPIEQDKWTITPGITLFRERAEIEELHTTVDHGEVHTSTITENHTDEYIGLSLELAREITKHVSAVLHLEHDLSRTGHGDFVTLGVKAHDIPLSQKLTLDAGLSATHTSGERSEQGTFVVPSAALEYLIHEKISVYASGAAALPIGKEGKSGAEGAVGVKIQF